jgi:methylmalonyl-CoA/ethylmalonyl-CoA epimerase
MASREDALVAISGSINHFGMAVKSIEEFLDNNEALYGGFTRGPLITNDTQKVREMFITDGQSVIELLEPMGEQSPLDGFLAKNPAGGLIHVALDVDNLETAIAEVEDQGGRLITAPVPDIAFNYRRIAFVFLNGQVTELIEKA